MDLLAEGVIDFPHQLTDAIHDRFNLPCVVHIIDCTSVAEPLGHIVPVIKADLNLSPSIAQSQISHENADLTDIGLKPDIDVHYPV